jgi:hypothetical protein
MNELYIAGMAVQAIRVFRELIEIGRAHSEKLGNPYIKWAQDLTLELVQSHENQVKFWIRAVCDPPDFSTDLNWGDPYEVIMGKTWCAPMLLVMRPSRYMDFDAARQWERADRETSKRWMSSFAEMFTIHIKIHIDRLADEKTVELAKQPKSVPEAKAAVAQTDLPAQMTPIQSVPAKVNVKQEYRRVKIDERNRKI